MQYIFCLSKKRYITPILQIYVNFCLIEHVCHVLKVSITGLNKLMQKAVDKMKLTSNDCRNQMNWDQMIFGIEYMWGDMTVRSTDFGMK